MKCIEFAKWCFKHYKRMHDVDIYTERFDNSPIAKRYTMEELFKIWKNKLKNKQYDNDVSYDRKRKKI